MYTDMPEKALREHRSAVIRPDDFDEFWRGTLDVARRHPLDVALRPVAAGLTTVEVHDLCFSGWNGDRVSGWLVLPTHRPARVPVVVEYLGYGGGRGLPIDHLLWASAGYAHLVMDTRGQGSNWAAGATPDSAGSGPAAPGVMTRGIETPETYYYRRLTADAVRAVEAARAIPALDGDQLVVLGTSQGGGLAVAVGGLVRDLAGVFPRVPFLCDIPRAITITDNDPYQEVVRYLAIHRDREESTLRTLSYFDSALHALNGTSEAHFSAALMDATCPPSTVFAAYNAWPAAKDIEVYRYNAHEGGGSNENSRTLRELEQIFR